MSDCQPVPSGLHDSERVLPTFVANLQRAANRANKNCDAAVALAHNLADQLRKAHARIEQLDDEADGLFDRLLAEVQTAIEKADADAGVDATIREADECIARLQAELACARWRIEQVEVEAGTHIDRIKIEAEARVAAAQREANKRVNHIQRENEDKIIRLEADLTEASNRAERAEQRLILIRSEIDNNLLPSTNIMHDLARDKPVEGSDCST